LLLLASSPGFRLCCAFDELNYAADLARKNHPDAPSGHRPGHPHFRVGLLLLTMTNRLGRAIDRVRQLTRELPERTDASANTYWRR